MRRKKLWRGLAVVFAAALMAFGTSRAWCGSNPSPNPNAYSTTQIYWSSSTSPNGSVTDNNYPAYSNGGIGPDGAILKTNNQIVMYPVSYNSSGYPNFTAPGSSDIYDDSYFITKYSASYVPKAGANGSASVNNMSREYYDPDGPSLSGCTAGGRNIIAALAKETGSSPHYGILLASSPTNAYNHSSANWYQAWIPFDCAAGTACGSSFSLGWNNDFIVIAVNNISATSGTAPGLLVINHDQFECGNSQGALTKWTSGSLGAGQYQIFDKTSSWNNAMQSACVAPGYRSNVSNEFSGAGVFLISDNNGSTNSVNVSSVTNSTGHATFNSSAFTVPCSGCTSITSWTAPPSTISQYGTGTYPDINYKPGDARFTGCAARGGAIWAAQTVGNGTKASTVQWWEIGDGTYNNVTQGNVYVQDSLFTSSGYSFFNPSIIPNSDCSSSSTPPNPECDALIGFTLVSTSGSGNTTYMSSAYQVETQANGVDYYTPNAYESGTHAYMNQCDGGTGGIISTAALSSATVDSNPNKNVNGMIIGYPNDTNFFTTEQFQGYQNTPPTGQACAGKDESDWELTWAQVPY